MSRFTLIALIVWISVRSSVCPKTGGDEARGTAPGMQEENLGGGQKKWSNKGGNSVVRDGDQRVSMGVNNGSSREGRRGDHIERRTESSDGGKSRNWASRVPTGGFFITSQKQCQSRCSRKFGYWEDPKEEDLLKQPKIAAVGKINFKVKCSCLVDEELNSLITERFGPTTAKYYAWLSRVWLGLKYRNYFNKGKKQIRFVKSSELTAYIREKHDEWTKMRMAQEELAALPDYSNTKRK